MTFEFIELNTKINFCQSDTAPHLLEDKSVSYFWVKYTPQVLITSRR